LYLDCLDLHSFPTRRSSDLYIDGSLVLPIYKAFQLFGRVHSRFLLLLFYRLTVFHFHIFGTNILLLHFPPVSFCPFLTLIFTVRSEEHTSELQSRENLVCRL